MPEKETIPWKKIVSRMPIDCNERPGKYIELISYQDGSGEITCDLFHTQNCSHSCVYSYVCRLAPKGLVK
jgi:hypothetical protein